MSPNRYFITGGSGNLAAQLAQQLSATADEIVLFDLTLPARRIPAASYEQGDITDAEYMRSLLRKFRPTHILHFASLLSGRSEQDRKLAWRINASAGFELFEAALEFGVQGFFFPSTGATYGAGVPDPLPEDQAQWPENLYGVTKIAMERLGYYYWKRHGLDFRCLRLPLVISRFAPAGAVSAYASRAFVEAAAGNDFEFPVRPDAAISTIYVKDVVAGILRLVAAPADSLTQRVYNIHGFTPAAGAIAEAIRCIIPSFRSTFVPRPDVNALIDGWPEIHNDDAARRDWAWKPAFDLRATATDLLAELQRADAI